MKPCLREIQHWRRLLPTECLSEKESLRGMTENCSPDQKLGEPAAVAGGTGASAGCVEDCCLPCSEGIFTVPQHTPNFWTHIGGYWEPSGNYEFCLQYIKAPLWHLVDIKNSKNVPQRILVPQIQWLRIWLKFGVNHRGQPGLSIFDLVSRNFFGHL